MSERQITIRMPKELLQKWLAGLRSGDFKQGRGAMCTHDGHYCCLGVLQKTVGDAVEDGAWPSPAWRKTHGVNFLYKGYENWPAPFLPALGQEADAANDTGYTFAEIADAIEACAEGF